MNNLVCVYGTLKLGFGNNVLISQGGGEFMGAHIIPSGYFMRSLGGFPAIYQTTPGSHESPIHCEIFSVDDETLSHLDGLEGHPNWYQRTLIPTSYGMAWVYVMPESESDSSLSVVRDGVWRGWQQNDMLEVA